MDVSTYRERAEKLERSGLLRSVRTKDDDPAHLCVICKHVCQGPQDHAAGCSVRARLQSGMALG